jgi:branched-chain amino acid transport system ATP-binding protein
MSNSQGLTAERLRSGYERDVFVVKDVTVKVPPATVVGVIGANGAGKSSLIKTLLGYLKPQSGRVMYNDEDITSSRPDLAAVRGIGYLMEGHSIFPSLTVEENLLLGMWPWRRNRSRVAAALNSAYSHAPLLKQRRQTSAGLLSGGQQRILEIERLAMSSPKLALMDEPSLGLSPKLAEQIFLRVDGFRRSGTAVLLIDQNVRRVAELADYVYVLQLGTVKLEAPGPEISSRIEQIVKEFI